MLGLFIGLICGGIEFFLLQKYVDQLTGGKPIAWWLPLVKIAVVALFLIPCGLFIPKQLPFAGAGVAAALIIGSFVKFIVYMHTSRKNTRFGKKEDDTNA